MNSRFITPGTLFAFSVSVALFSLAISTLTAEELARADERPSELPALQTESLLGVSEEEPVDDQQNPPEEGNGVEFADAGEEPGSSPEDGDLEESPATDSSDPSDDLVEPNQPMITEEDEPADDETIIDNLLKEDVPEALSPEGNIAVLVEEPILTEADEEKILDPADEPEPVVEEVPLVVPTPKLETEPVPVIFGQMTSLLPRELRMMCVGRDWQDEYSDREACLKDARNQQEDYLAELEGNLVGAMPARGGVLTIQEIRNQLEDE